MALPPIKASPERQKEVEELYRKHGWHGVQKIIEQQNRARYQNAVKAAQGQPGVRQATVAPAHTQSGPSQQQAAAQQWQQQQLQAQAAALQQQQLQQQQLQQQRPAAQVVPTAQQVAAQQAAAQQWQKWQQLQQAQAVAYVPTPVTTAPQYSQLPLGGVPNVQNTKASSSKHGEGGFVFYPGYYPKLDDSTTPPGAPYGQMTPLPDGVGPVSGQEERKMTEIFTGGMPNSPIVNATAQANDAIKILEERLREEEEKTKNLELELKHAKQKTKNEDLQKRLDEERMLAENIKNSPIQVITEKQEESPFRSEHVSADIKELSKDEVDDILSYTLLAGVGNLQVSGIKMPSCIKKSTDNGGGDLYKIEDTENNSNTISIEFNYKNESFRLDCEMNKSTKLPNISLHAIKNGQDYHIKSEHGIDSKEIIGNIDDQEDVFYLETLLDHIKEGVFNDDVYMNNVQKESEDYFSGKGERLAESFTHESAQPQHSIEETGRRPGF